MISADDSEPQDSRPDSADLRIGNPERQLAIEALQTHLTAKRLDPAEYEKRVESCEFARTRSELLRVFHDLPAPHPALPSTGTTPAEPEGDDTIPPVAVAGCLTLGLGIPVAVVFGVVYGAWWTLAVPVAITVAMSYAERFRTG